MERQQKKGHAMIKGWTLIFYGTTQQIDKNDPISVPVEPPTSVANNPVTVLTKPAAGKGNRKQQKQQPKQSGPNNSSLSSLSPSTFRKIGKPNQKNQSNKNGKQRQQQPTTSNRPPTTLYFNKDRKYEYINGVISVNKPSTGQSTTQRPLKVPNKNNAVKDVSMTNVKAPIKAPKQVKEIDNDPPNNNNRQLQLEPSTIEPHLEHIEFLDNFSFTSNPNIPKLFQQYEKIQEFYPEFHPYIGINGKSSTRYPQTNVGNNGKPSRANQQFQSQFSSSLSIASNGFSASSSIAGVGASSTSQDTTKFLSTALLGTATKKNSQAQSMTRKQNSTIFTRKNGKG